MSLIDRDDQAADYEFHPDDVVTCADGSSTTVGHLSDLADRMFANERAIHDREPDLYHLSTGRRRPECVYCNHPDFGTERQGQ